MKNAFLFRNYKDKCLRRLEYRMIRVSPNLLFRDLDDSKTNKTSIPGRRTEVYTKDF